MKPMHLVLYISLHDKEQHKAVAALSSDLQTAQFACNIINNYCSSPSTADEHQKFEERNVIVYTGWYKYSYLDSIRRSTSDM